VMLRGIFKLVSRQSALDYGHQLASPNIKVSLAPGINSEADFVGRAESDYVYAVIRSGLRTDPAELAYLMLNDRNQVDYVQYLLDDLEQRGVITRRDGDYTLPGYGGMIPFENEPALKILFQDIAEADVPDQFQPGVATARKLAKKAMVQRSQDFAASSDTYLKTCRLQWDAVGRGEPGATLEDLRWYMASYASAIAGKLSQVNRDYAGARPYYLAFFALVQDNDPLWSRMRGLINPMLAYYWANAGRELDLNINAWNLSMSSPAQIAVYAATHPDLRLRKLWRNITFELAHISPGLLKRISSQLMLNREDSPENIRAAEEISEILSETHQD